MKKNKDTDFSLEFNTETQRFLLSCLISDPDSFSISRTILDAKYFDSEIRQCARYIIEYSDEHHKLPPPDLVTAKTRTEIGLIDTASLPDGWLLGEVERFCRTKALEQIIFEGVDLIQQGRMGEIEQRVKDAMAITLMTDLGMDYFSTVKERLQRMKDHSAFISTGWATLDKKWGGGHTIGGLDIFAGGSGAGKSLVLQNLAINQAFAGKNVAYISLELSEDLIGLRLDAMVSARGTKDVMRDINDASFTIAMIGKKSGTLVVKKLPQSGTTANDIRAYVREYEIKTGKKLDAIYVDYLDLLAPINTSISLSDLFVKDKYVTEELRSLMGDLKIYGATASQLNRSAVQTSEFDHSHIAGGISKINTADNVVALLSTPSMKEKGVYQLQFIKCRSSSSTGQTANLDYDPVTMRISDPEISDDVDAPASIKDKKKILNEKIDNETENASDSDVEAPKGNSVRNLMSLINKS